MMRLRRATIRCLRLWGSEDRQAVLPPCEPFFEGMPANSGMAFVVIVHLSPEHESLMAEILQRSSSMPVIEVQREEKIEANRVYVIPPRKHLSLEKGKLRLSELEPERGKRVAVDLFLRTLAEAQGQSAIGIVLSGADTDGAIGIKRIKEHGGLTIAQEPTEAEHTNATGCDCDGHGGLGIAGRGDAKEIARFFEQRTAASSSGRNYAQTGVENFVWHRCRG